MVPYTRYTYGTYYNDAYSWVGLNTATSRTEGQTTAMKRKLVCPTSNPGNRVDPTAYSYSYEKLVYPTGSLQSWSKTASGWTGSVNTRTGPLGWSSYQHIFSVNTAALDNRALSKVYDKIRQSNLNLAVDIAEWKQTAVMLRNAVRAVRKPLRTFTQSVKRYRKAVGQERFSKEMTDGLGGAWLAWTYGWNPLAGSISDLLALTDRIVNVSHRVKGRAYIKSEEKGSFGSLPRNDWSAQGMNGIEYTIRYRVDDAQKAKLSAMTSLDPKLIAWELTTLSFVVDWFVDIGGYLELAEAALGRGLVFESGQKTTLTIAATTSSLSQTSGTVLNGTFGRGVGTYKKVSFSRVRLYSFPSPRQPTINVQLGWRRLLSATALINSFSR